MFPSYLFNVSTIFIVQLLLVSEDNNFKHNLAIQQFTRTSVFRLTSFKDLSNFNAGSFSPLSNQFYVICLYLLTLQTRMIDYIKNKTIYITLPYCMSFILRPLSFIQTNYLRIILLYFFNKLGELEKNLVTLGIEVPLLHLVVK